MNCDNCNAPNITPVPNGTGETLCAACAQAALNHGHYSAAECTPLQESAASHGQWEHDCEMLANALAFTNERFDRARFLEACGVAS